MRRIFSLVSLVLLGAVMAVPIAHATDTQGPTISPVAPLAATWNVPQTFWATADDPSGVAECRLQISSDEDQEAAMTYSTERQRWEGSWTFSDDRTANSIRAVCTDTAGNETIGTPRVMTVSGVPIATTTGSPSTTTGSGAPLPPVDATTWARADIVATSPVLIKTVCPGGEDFRHPCRTVYFLDRNGNRHAFPNEQVYRTWYADWGGIYLVSAQTMASFTLSRNVTYKPGARMVKFPTVATVYVVGRYGELRAIASEAVALALYGANWSQQIDDLSEAFFDNYRMGAAVTAASDFSVTAQLAAVASINDNLQ